jgi:hypothetical protein
VEAFHKAGVAAGGADNGEPGMRPDYSADYFAAFLTDPDGYRVEAYTSAPTSQLIAAGPSGRRLPDAQNAAHPNTSRSTA